MSDLEWARLLRRRAYGSIRAGRMDRPGPELAHRMTDLPTYAELRADAMVMILSTSLAEFDHVVESMDTIWLADCDLVGRVSLAMVGGSTEVILVANATPWP
jgi:hypothetical protein